MSSSIEVPETCQPIPGSRATLAGRCRAAYVAVILMTIMSLGCVVMLAVALLTLFQAPRMYREVIGKWISRAFLWACGVKVIVHRDGPLPTTQTVYISNHTSTLDVFILSGLGLPRTRFFLSGFLRKILPLGVMGYLGGTFWTVPQTMPQRRAWIFQRAERVLRRTGELVYLSPEGERVTTGRIGPFNKGAFHLATALRAPLLPLYIAIPRHCDPGRGLDIRRCVVHVYFKQAIPTEDWNIEDLEKNRTHVHNYFVELHDELKVS